MNINEQLHELGTMGGFTYAPNDDLISSLVTKTKRVRAVRQGTTTLIGTVGAMVIGIAAVQAYSAAKDDPAFRDRNVINNKNGLTPIELYRAKFGNDNPTRSYDSAVDLSSIIAKLKASAAGGGSTPKGTPAPQAAPPPVVIKPATPSDAGGATKPPADPYAQCKADHPEQAEKYYDCALAKYVAKDGYFGFGNGGFYPTITWMDAATGLTATGNWSGSNPPGGWEKKAILVDPGSTWYREYVYMGSNATWSGSTCTGKADVMAGTDWQASCLPEWKVAATGKTYKVSGGLVWVLADQSLRWHSALSIWADPAAPPAGWSWDGSAWIETSV